MVSTSKVPCVPTPVVPCAGGVGDIMDGEVGLSRPSRRMDNGTILTGDHDDSGIQAVHGRAADGAAIVRPVGQRTHLPVLANADLHPSQPTPWAGIFVVP